MKEDYVDRLLRRLPMLPVSDRLELLLAEVISKVEKGELYQEDAEPGSTGQPKEKGR